MIVTYVIALVETIIILIIFLNISKGAFNVIDLSIFKIVNTNTCIERRVIGFGMYRITIIKSETPGAKLLIFETLFETRMTIPRDI